MNYSVYKHTAPNGKIYIGITSMKPENRWNNGRGYNKQPYFMSAIVKYGWGNFKHEIIYSGLTKEEAEQREKELISKYKSNNKNYGYNIENGGNSIGKMAEGTKLKISKRLKGVPKESPPWLGKHHTEETRKKLREIRVGEKNPMYGKTMSVETKLKMSESHKNCNLCKAILCVETGEVFISSSEVARAMNLSQGNVASVARGERKHTKGYHFKYVSKSEVTK